jgi:hypothetical protein
MSSAQNVIAEVMQIIGRLSGIKGAPDFPPEDSAKFPFAIAYEGPGTYEWGTAGGDYGEMKAMLSVIVELHVARIDLPKDVQKASYYSDAIPNAIMKGIRTDRLNGTMDANSAISTSGLIGMAFGSRELNTLGFRFTIEDIKIRKDIA